MDDNLHKRPRAAKGTHDFGNIVYLEEEQDEERRGCYDNEAQCMLCYDFEQFVIFTGGMAVV